jgi:hypothetical protein
MIFLAILESKQSNYLQVAQPVSIVQMQTGTTLLKMYLKHSDLNITEEFSFPLEIYGFSGETSISVNVSR